MARFGTISATALLASASVFAVAVAAGAQDADQPLQDREVIVVRGANIPDEKRDTSEISSIVDAADFSITGDADAAAALQRVTGLSLSRGRFVIVRGLNERYTTATINRSPLPSPEPLRRVAPLDLFPTNVLESVLVQKTYSPEYSLEFGGGLIDLRTTALPDDRFLEVSFSGGYNTEITGDDAVQHDGGEQDWTGFDNGDRNRPELIGDAFFDNDLFDNSTEARQELARAFANPSFTVIQRGPIGANGGASINGGQRFDLSPNLSIGIVGAAGYDNSWSARNGRRQDPTIGGTLNSDFDRERTENEIKSNLLLSLGADLFDDHQIKFTALAARSTEKGTEVQAPFNDLSLDDGRREETQWFERQTWIGQVSGEHYFPNLFDLELAWRVSHSEALRDAPFGTSIEYRDNDGTEISEARNLRFTFETLDDIARDVGVDAELPIVFGPIDAIIKGGWTYRDSLRKTINREYFLQGTVGQFDDLRVDLLIPAAGLEAEAFPNTQNVPEAFRGSLELDAFYLAGDVQLGPFIRAQAGVRFEDSLQLSDAFTRDGVDNGVIEQANSSEFILPAGTITWNPFNNQQVRFGYSQTIVRPQFRELAPQLFLNNLTELLAQGNPRLTNTEVENFDLRYEWYFGRDQFLTFGLFYKQIDNPIVETTRTAEDTVFTSFINAPEATLQGFEFELERRVPLPEFLAFPWLTEKEFFIATNYTFTDSELDNAGIATRFERGLTDAEIAGGGIDNRDANGVGTFSIGNFLFNSFAAAQVIPEGAQLQGQSDHLFNLQFGYDDYDARSRARIFLNFASERILFYRSDDNSRLETFEQPPFTVDFRYSRAFDVFNRELEMSFTARNLFADEYLADRDTEVGRVLFDQYDLGRTFSIGVTGRF